MSDRQAIWVALRTLRQRPTVVDRTEGGATVYEIRSVRLVLPPGATHFKRLMSCAKCGRSVPGPSVVAPADLDRPPNSMFCDRCVRSPVPPRPEIQDGRAPAPRPAAPPVVPSPRPTPDAVEGLPGLTEKVAGVLRGQNAELAKMSAAVVEVRAEMRRLAAQLAAQAEADPAPAIEATLARELADVRAGLAAMVDSATQPLQASLAHGLDHLAARIAALQQRIDEEPVVRSEVAQIAEANRALAHAQGELDQRMSELAAQLAPGPGSDPSAVVARDLADLRADVTATIGAEHQLRIELADGLDHVRSQVAAVQQRIDDESAARAEIAHVAEANRALAQAQYDLGQKVREVAALPRGDPDAVRAQDVAELRADLVARIGAEDTQLRVELAEGLDVLRAEIASLEQRNREELAAVATLLEAQRKDLTEMLHDVAHETLMSVAEPLRDLTRAREEFERRLESLQHRALEDHRRVEALNASASAGASRLHALEQRLDAGVQRLIRPADTEHGGQEPPAAPQEERRPARALLESLEQQLREAEERLSQL